MSTFDRMCGELYQDHTDEEQFICLGCSKPKLYRNKTTGRYICFVCGYAGQSKTGDLHPVYVPGRDKPNLSEFKMELEWVGIHCSILDRGLSLEDARVLGFKERGLPLYLKKKLVGFQKYWPGGNPKYVTLGERGLKCSGLWDNVLRIYLFEGMFDWASAYRKQKLDTVGNFVFTAGNQLTPQQLDEIFLNTRSDQTIYICFDNDKPFAAARAAQQLGSIRQVRFKFPPTQYKDWDEAIQAGEEF